MKQLLSRMKPYLQWAILGGTLFFLAKALKDNWREVAAIRISSTGWACLGVALLVTLLAHTWTGWVWGWILNFLDQRVKGSWAIRVYLKTNIAKYMPGNVWHYYGRVRSSANVGVSAGVATLSVLLEALLMAAAALMLAVVFSQQKSWGLQLVGLAIALIAVHPILLNPAIQVAARLKGKATKTASESGGTFKVKQYPLMPLIGELGFIGLRAIGFLWTLLALTAIAPDKILPVLGAFSLAWTLGLVIPGAPGGIGVFEATMIALDQFFSPGIMLSVVALYRLVSILAEAIGAALAWMFEPRNLPANPAD